MKLHYSKIILFSISLSIFFSLSYVYNKNKPHITSYTPITASRVLSECDIQSSIYDKDADIKSVKEIFDRQTSQRFEEYEERMITQRQKYKEQCDKDIEQIILKDKMEKSLAEKVETGCLKCGCGLGGVAASVGLFGGLGTYGWKSAALATAEKVAMVEGESAAKAVGDAAGVQALISGLKERFNLEQLWGRPLKEFITPKTYCNADLISKGVKEQYELWFQTDSKCGKLSRCYFYKSMEEGQGIEKVVENAEILVGEAKDIATNMKVSVTESQIAIAKDAELAKITAESSYLFSAIGYSVLAILIIVLVMIIIYLVLRYRRKTKMDKKAQYTKLLNQ